MIFASCNQAVDDGNGNYVNLNDGNPVTAAMAIDAITNQRGGEIYVKIDNTITDIQPVIDAINGNASVMVNLDLSETWKDADELTPGAGDPDIFGGVLNVDDATIPGSRQIDTFGEIGASSSTTTTWAVAGANTITFAGLKNLKSISLPFTVKLIGAGAFEGCENLETVTINFFFTSDVDKTNLYATEYMYDDKFLLAGIDDFAFKGCKNLRTFILVSDPDNDDVDEGFPVSITKIGAEAFKDCYSLEGVRFLNTRNMGRSYQHEVDGVAFVAHDTKYPAGETQADRDALYYVDADGIGRNGLSKYSSSIDAAVAVDDGTPDQSELVIGIGAFENCTSLAYVNFNGKKCVNGQDDPADFTVITDDMVSHRAFNGCTSLAEIYLPTPVATPVAIAPRYNSYLVGTTSPGIANSVIGDCAFGKTTAGEVILVYGDQSFQYTALENEAVRDLFHAHDYGVPNTIGHVQDADGDDYVEVIGARAFFGCKNLSEVLLPSTVTSTVGIANLGDGAFANTAIEYIWVHGDADVFSILEGWQNNDTDKETAPYWTGALVDKDPTVKTDMPTTIYAWFVTPYSGDLTYLPKLDSQNPRTKVLGDKLADIKGDAFYNNVDVEKILFPATLDDSAAGIGNYAFCNAENLQEVYSELAAADWGTAADTWETNDSYFGSFANTPAVSIQCSDVASGRISK